MSFNFQMIYLSLMDWTFVLFFPKCICLNHNFQLDWYFGGGGFGGNQVMGGNLHYRVSTLRRWDKWACFLSLLSTMWCHNKKIILSKPGRWHSPKTHPCWVPWASELWKMKIVVSVTKYNVFLSDQPLDKKHKIRA